MTDTRWCPHCEAERPLTEFYPNKAAASGIDGYCKEYRKEKNRERARRSREAKREKMVAAGLNPRYRSDLRIEDDGRECSGCRRFKPWAEFHLDRTSTTGHQTKCKVCVQTRQQAAASTEAGREAARRRTAEYRARKRDPDWQPRQVTRHAQLDCDGTQHRCTHCGAMKPVTAFPSNKETPCGFDPNCTECRHRRRVERRSTNHNDIRTREILDQALRKYGITSAEYNWLLAEQNGACALCLAPETQGDQYWFGKKRLSVDHSHEHCGPSRACKECIRGLLCHNCNVGLGMFEGRVALAGVLGDYLTRRPFAST